MTEKSDQLTVRLILPTGVKEITGLREEVIERVTALVRLESDLGESYAEIIPFPTPKRYHPSQKGFSDEK